MSPFDPPLKTSENQRFWYKVGTLCGNKVGTLLQIVDTKWEQEALLNPSLPSFPFWSCQKHQKTKDFLMFSGGSKGNIGKKWVKGSSARTISQSTRYLFQTIITEMLHKNYPKMTSNAKQNRQNRKQKDKKLVCKRISRKCRL